MNPAEYLKLYTAPFAGKQPPAGSQPPFLQPERYYSCHETAAYMYNFPIDQLTRSELLRMVRETGVSDPGSVSPGQYIGRAREKDQRLAEQDRRLEELERRLEIRQELLNAWYFRLAVRLVHAQRRLRRWAAETTGRLPGRQG